MSDMLIYGQTKKGISCDIDELLRKHAAMQESRDELLGALEFCSMQLFKNRLEGVYDNNNNITVHRRKRLAQAELRASEVIIKASKGE